MAELLFERGKQHENDMWDDSALVAAWNRQLLQDASQLESAKASLTAARQDHAVEQEESQSSASAKPAIPPMPEFADEGMKRMLEAWYWAGYWTGHAAASRS